MIRLQLRGCLPALLVLLLLAGVTAAVVAAGLAVVLPLAALLLVVGAARAAWRRLTGRGPTPPDAPGRIEVVEREPAGPVVDVGPVVEAQPRDPPAPPRFGDR
ncbi:MAG TPA: hypothetical protein VFP50_05965 [Anaeromyxobacteraceae bacterium]|nr:hypothetical protein [Anaeromyxobacteraceae bacterium]